MKLKKATGNMYPWVTHMHTHIAGECPFRCAYCYTKDLIPRRFRKPGQSGRPDYCSGPLRLSEESFHTQYGSRKPMTIFMEHTNDIGAPGVPDEWRERIFIHARLWPRNTYVFQSKNPKVFMHHLDDLPQNVILGTTAETNRDISKLSAAPHPIERLEMMQMLPGRIKKFITIEPVLDFDVDVFAKWISFVKPFFVNLGADSKRHDLEEPSVSKIMSLVEALASYGIELREKHNLARLKLN